jgi:hypothetical protein
LHWDLGPMELKMTGDVFGTDYFSIFAKTALFEK